MVDAHRGADRVAIRLRSDETEPQAAVAGGLVVAKEHRRAVVGRHQQVDVAIAVEVAAGQPAPDPAGCAKPAPAADATSTNLPLP